MAELLNEMRRLTERIDSMLRSAERSSPGFGPSVDMTRPDQPEAVAVLLEANALMLQAMETTLLGECRVEEPYEPLRPIIDENGVFRWCCTHSPPHCS